MAQVAITYRGYGRSSFDAIVRRGYASYTGLPQPAPTGYQYEVVGSLSPPVGGYSLETGQSPAVGIGDIFEISLVTTPSSYSILPNNDGTVEILANGDTSRQEFLYGIYRLSTNALSTGGIVWVNEVAPIWSTNLATVTFVLNSPVSINLASSFYAYSTEGDALTFAVVSGSLPVGLSLSNAGVLSGTPTVAAVYTVTISATDITGTSTNTSSQMTVSGTLTAGVPNVLGFTLNNAIAAYQNIGFTVILTSIVNSVTVKSGLVAGQSPVAGTISNTKSLQTIYLSMGPNTTQETNL